MGKHVQTVIDFITGAKIVNIYEKSDLPAPLGNIITLEANTTYIIHGEINLGADELVLAANNTIRGRHPLLDYILSTTTGNLVTATNSFRLFEVGLKADSGTLFDVDGGGSAVVLMFGIRFATTGALGTFDQMSLFEISTGLMAGGYSSGLVFTGASDELILQDLTMIDTGTAVKSINLGSSTWNSLKINGCGFTVGTNGFAFGALANGANFNTDKFGAMAITNFTLGAGATSVENYDSLDTKWKIGLDNTGILPSDRLSPTGWEVSSDGESSPATISVTTTPVKLQIDGGGTSDSSQLPRAIQGTVNLWDTTNDKITPITEGDAYDLRVQVGIGSIGGGADTLSLILDIGATPDGTGGAGSTVVVRDSKAIVAGDTTVFSFPIFTLSTFLSNGGTLWLESNTGTITISSRSILLVRTHSGVS